MSSKIDIVVAYRGAERAFSISDEETILPLNVLTRYTSQNAAKNGRKLVRIGEFTNSINNLSLIRQTIEEMKFHTRNKTVGAIFVYGSSSGGRNALDLVTNLFIEPQFSFAVQYVALLDAAFFPGDTLDIPNMDEPTNTPMMNRLVQVPIAFRRENFFQIAGNHRESRIIGRDLFVSSMKGKEIHGNVPFFNSRDLTNQIRMLPNTTGKSRDDGHHGNLIAKSLPIVHSEIANILDDLIPRAALINFNIPGKNDKSQDKKTYVVASGDNLSKISKKFYGTEVHWQKIYAANRTVIGPNPNHIKVGQRLQIPK